MTRSVGRIIAGACLAVILFISLLGLAWGIGFGVFLSSMPRDVAHAEQKTDVIIVLTGGENRLSVGMDMLRAGLSPKLLISGVGTAVTLPELETVTPELSPDLFDQVSLGYDAQDTAGNAREARQWIETAAAPVASLRLVTSAYHMPRSMAEFRDALPEVTIIAHPVFADSVRHDAWWRHRGTAVLFAREYTKYILAQLRMLVS